MHEAALAKAAVTAPIRLLGLKLRPYSLWHELLLTNAEGEIRDTETVSLPQREKEIATKFEALLRAVLICSQSWKEYARMDSDPFIGFKLWVWKKRLERMSIDPDKAIEVFAKYRAEGSLEFPLSEEVKVGKKPGRSAGAPFLLRLNQFLQTKMGKTEAEAWDYPFGLAKMRMEAFYENEGAIDIYNSADKEFDDFVAEQEAKARGQESGVRSHGTAGGPS